MWKLSLLNNYHGPSLFFNRDRDLLQKQIAMMLKSPRYVVWNDYCVQTRDPCYGDIISHVQNALLD